VKLSAEALSLIDLETNAPPDVVRTGDLYVISNQLQYVMLVLGHKKNGRRSSDGHTFVFMYHWGEPSLRTKPADVRDFDGNANFAEGYLHWARERGESVRYAGNIFDRVPLSSLVATSV
jgi:hypothetical protein